MFKKFLLFILAALLVGCTASNVVETQLPVTPGATFTAMATKTALPSATATPVPSKTPLPSPTVTPTVPPVSFGPSDFPKGINPLTGLPVGNNALLERRPLAVKVSNDPRAIRPQWGLSLADIVYEYYPEKGRTRFVAIYYGHDAEQVGPIRSARLFDAHIIRMYKSPLAFVGADQRVLNYLFAAEFANLLVSEFPARCPPMCRIMPDTWNHVVTNTKDLSAYITKQGIPNTRQNLDGMVFTTALPALTGTPINQLTVRFSQSFYTRWTYDPATNRYSRAQDAAEAATPADETYTPLQDKLTGEILQTNNIVVIFVPYEDYYRTATTEIFDVKLNGFGPALLFRNGQMYQTVWGRGADNVLLSLFYDDGTRVPFTPGTTWFEVVGKNSILTTPQSDSARVQFSLP